MRFGRALGYGARHAAKTLAQAADAAAAPNPAPKTPAARPPRPVSAAAASGARRVPDAGTLRTAGREAKRSLVAPVVRFSSVIWLQVTGVFFALIAFTMAAAAWRARAALRHVAVSGAGSAAGAHPVIKLCVYIGVCAVFTYFSVTSFLRAARR